MNIPVKIAGITRIRNEAHIILDTLEFYSKICNAGIFIYDDASTDETLDICKSYRLGIEGCYVGIGLTIADNWDTDPKLRQKAEGFHRRVVHEQAKKEVNPDWILCFDADERIEFDFENFDYDSYDAVYCKLFDYYITPEDADKSWKERRWIGPEFRRLPMLFRNTPEVYFYDRPMKFKENARIITTGYVKHYGKAISVQDWENKCHYYMTYRDGTYVEKWKNRRGRAIHKGVSDFGNPLITWEEKDEEGFMLGPKMHEKEKAFWTKGNKLKYTDEYSFNDPVSGNLSTYYRGGSRIK